MVDVIELRRIINWVFGKPIKFDFWNSNLVIVFDQ